MKTAQEFKEHLEKIGACEDAREWADAVRATITPNFLSITTHGQTFEIEISAIHYDIEGNELTSKVYFEGRREYDGLGAYVVKTIIADGPISMTDCQEAIRDHIGTHSKFSKVEFEPSVTLNREK